MSPKKKPEFTTVDEYIALQPEDVRATLEELRKTIKAASPKADEIISYSMPAYRFKGILLWFAAHKNHYGLYVMAKTIKVFKPKLKEYELSKGTIRIPKNKPFPFDLIKEIVIYRVEENLEKALFKEMLKVKKVKK
jgi:uncharacterized protein YdhG (YjbR/CyaY superfamily)